MYTVLRLTKGRVSRNSADALANEIKKLVPEARVEERARGDGVSCEICASNNWFDHVKQIGSFVQVLSSVLSQAAHDGFEATFDVAVEPEDGEGKMAILLPFHRQLLQALVNFDVSLEVTVYGGAEGEVSPEP